MVAHASYEYERRRDYTVPGSAPEVRAVTIKETRYELDQAVGAERGFRMTALEHCRDEFRNEVYTDGLTGVPVADGPALIAGVRHEIEDPVSAQRRRHGRRAARAPLLIRRAHARWRR